MVETVAVTTVVSEMKTEPEVRDQLLLQQRSHFQLVALPVIPSNL